MPPADEGRPSSRRRKKLSSDTLQKATIVLPSAGTVLAGRYRLEEELGRGGMGVVFRAYDEELDIPVAIKILPPELAFSKRAVKDLKREAVLAMKLRHPGIVALYNFAHEEDIKFLVMELLEGRTLDDRLTDEGTLGVEAVVEMARELGAAIDYAHGERVVHRDLKPSNIFLHAKEAGETIRLMDFGIARQMRDSLSRVSKVESSGTLLYMSPEQLKGKPVDTRSDIYSLAATLYECLAGQPPFYQGSISYQIVNNAPEPVPDVPDAVNAALLKGLAKEPDERFATAGLFARALAGEGEPSPPERDTLPSVKPPPPPAAPVQVAAPTEPPRQAPPPVAEQTKPKKRSCLGRLLVPGFVIGVVLAFILASCGIISAITGIDEEDVYQIYQEIVGEEPAPEPATFVPRDLDEIDGGGKKDYPSPPRYVQPPPFRPTKPAFSGAEVLAFVPIVIQTTPLTQVGRLTLSFISSTGRRTTVNAVPNPMLRLPVPGYGYSANVRLVPGRYTLNTETQVLTSVGGFPQQRVIRLTSSFDVPPAPLGTSNVTCPLLTMRMP